MDVVLGTEDGTIIIQMEVDDFNQFLNWRLTTEYQKGYARCKRVHNITESEE